MHPSDAVNIFLHRPLCMFPGIHLSRRGTSEWRGLHILLKKNIYFVWLCQFIVVHVGSSIFVVACGIEFPDQGLNPGPLHGEQRVLATGLPGKFLHILNTDRYSRIAL